MTTTETLRSRIDRAAERAETEKAKLYKPDGSKLYSDEEHQRRADTIVEEMNRVASEVDEEAARLIEGKEGELYRHRYNDPTDALLDQQLEAANLRRPFVEEDCREMPLEELTKRLRGVLADNKKEMIWLFARYGRRRATRVLEELQKQNGTPEARRVTSACLRELEDILVHLEDRAKSSFDKKQAEEAERELEAARGLRFYVGQRRSEVDGSMERARQQHREMVRRAF